MNIYQKKKEHYSLIYLLDKLDNLVNNFLPIHSNYLTSNTNLDEVPMGINNCQYLSSSQFGGLDTVYGWGTMITIRFGHTMTQMYLPHQSEKQYIRNGWSGTWRLWREF